MKKLSNYFLPFFAIVIFLSIWQFSAMIFKIQEWILPSPLNVFSALWQARDLIIYHSGQTIVESLIGLAIAVILGGAIAIFMEWSGFFRKIMRPFLILSQTIPFIALAPLLVIWLGYGISPKIIVITLACFFPIAINFFDGFKSTDTNMIKLLKSMNASKTQIFTLVKLPSSLPNLFSGLRLSATYVVGVAVVSEWLGAERGLGVFLVRAAKSYATENVFALIFVITMLSLLFVAIIETLARFTMPWYYHKKI